MASVADVVILFKVAELAKRCGLRATDVDGSVQLINRDDDPKSEGYFSLQFPGVPTDPAKREKFEKFATLLGMCGSEMRVPELDQLEDAVDRALSLAPPARAR